MGLTLEQLEPGAVIKTPEIFALMGYNSEGAIYIGGAAETYPCFALAAGKPENLWTRSWPEGVAGKPAPMPEFEPIRADRLIELRKAHLAKSWSTLRHNYSSGADPEFFVLDARDGVIPAGRFLLPKKSTSSIFMDGVQGEFTIATDTCLERLSVNIAAQLAQAQRLAQARDSRARITIQNAFRFTPEQMASLSEEDLRFRCTSSLNIYDDAGELPNAREYPWRFAGGHIHVGCGKRSVPATRAMVRALDGIAGVAGVSLARNFDTRERRRMYGRAGEFRLPKHGLEYRVLSNFWLCSPLIYHLVFELVRYAYRIGEAGAFDLVYEGTEEEIRSCINNCDVQLASKLIERNKSLYGRIFGSIWAGNAVHKAMDTLQNGLEVAVSRPDNVVANWQEFSGSYPITWGRRYY